MQAERAVSQSPAPTVWPLPVMTDRLGDFSDAPKSKCRGVLRKLNLPSPPALLRRPVLKAWTPKFPSQVKQMAIDRERAQGQCVARRARARPERQARMTIRSRRETVTFRHPFRIRGVDRLLPAGAYEVITDEEQIEGLSFAAFRRIATMILVPGAASPGSTMEMLSVGSVDLADAQRIDASAPHE